MKFFFLLLMFFFPTHIFLLPLHSFYLFFFTLILLYAYMCVCTLYFCMRCGVVSFHSTQFSSCITDVLLHAPPSMLSSTAGYTRRSRVLGRRRDDTTLCSTLCPAMRTRGSCRIYAREASVRASVAAEKEEELLRSATELFRLQEEVVQDGAAADERQRTAAIESIVAELKCEKSYENWSLDAAVAERMASLRLRCCPYSHRRELQMDLRQSKRRDTAKMEEPNEEQEANEKRPKKGLSLRGSVSLVASRHYRNVWRACCGRGVSRCPRGLCVMCGVA
ncbi:hypothetical protein TCDM_04651 [Trypanosoma cruzi Dm28c]|uniref:Uncharacterized protein n=1 Tax=Trypanosoma cruzi Dm28c TaxID=1416333 RepID=V5BQ49_TRYCR|nr:hypothetical protein TCDM_04651 [Trypanosoma cruzi Dm28c]